MVDRVPILKSVVGRLESDRIVQIDGGKNSPSFPQHRVETYERHRQECVDQLGAKYELKAQGGSQEMLQSLVASGNPAKISVIHSYRLRHGGRDCFWLTFSFEESFFSVEREIDVTNIRQATIVELPFDAGNLFIRPETVSDRFAGWFGDADVDFDRHRPFSDKYHVVTDDIEKARRRLPSSFLDRLSIEDSLIVRIRARSAILTRDRSIRSDDAIQLADVALSLNS